MVDSLHPLSSGSNKGDDNKQSKSPSHFLSATRATPMMMNDPQAIPQITLPSPMAATSTPMPTVALTWPMPWLKLLCSVLSPLITYGDWCTWNGSTYIVISNNELAASSVWYADDSILRLSGWWPGKWHVVFLPCQIYDLMTNVRLLVQSWITGHLHTANCGYKTFKEAYLAWLDACINGRMSGSVLLHSIVSYIYLADHLSNAPPALFIINVPNNEPTPASVVPASASGIASAGYMLANFAGLSDFFATIYWPIILCGFIEMLQNGLPALSFGEVQPTSLASSASTGWQPRPPESSPLWPPALSIYSTSLSPFNMWDRPRRTAARNTGGSTRVSTPAASALEMFGAQPSLTCTPSAFGSHLSSRTPSVASSHSSRISTSSHYLISLQTGSSIRVTSTASVSAGMMTKMAADARVADMEQLARWVWLVMRGTTSDIYNDRYTFFFLKSDIKAIISCHH